ncbi:hypothetical protein F5Y08DRAFT_335938 [Xylaria arbuscula]|nr:hypothetical protein F5Y08DRAFT_335938 [Xylaria arbuscula]
MPGVVVEPLAGCIMWLPPKQDLVPIDNEIDDGCCNHPVVVLSTAARAAKVDILIITSFGGLDIEAKYPNRPSARQDHLPIAPSKAHPDNGKLLFLKDPSHELRKRSYVKTKNRHTILLASLQPYNRHGPEVFLSRRSYKVLIKHIQYSETVEEPLLVTSRHEQVHSDSPRHHVRRPIAAEDVLFIMQYMRAAHERERRRDSTYHVPRNYSNAPLGNERRPLLSREDRRSRPYGGRPVLPITHPIREGYGSDASKPFDWANFRKCIKIIISICFVLLLLYGFYRGGRWVVAACGGMLDWVKGMAQTCSENIQSIWSWLLHLMGY